MFYPKWVHSPAEPAHNLQNQDIIWFLQYNVIHSPTSLSVIVQLYEYNFSSHLFFFFKNVTEIFIRNDKALPGCSLMELSKPEGNDGFYEANQDFTV